ncbi:hypothetical protein GW750_07150 [bacterium]|nr:hypothetical protein [bacterium]
MQNYNIPDEIEIYCRDKNAMEVVILDKKLVFKTYNAKHRKLRPSFFKHIQKITI